MKAEIKNSEAEYLALKYTINHTHGQVSGYIEFDLEFRIDSISLSGHKFNILDTEFVGFYKRLKNLFDSLNGQVILTDNHLTKIAFNANSRGNINIAGELQYNKTSAKFSLDTDQSYFSNFLNTIESIAHQYPHLIK